MKCIKYLAIIPARSGSKGLPNKNIKEINGKSLIQITAESAEKSLMIDGIFFSSDSEEYIKNYKKIIIHKDVTGDYIRPKNISLDTSTPYEYIKDCIDYLEKNGINVENFIILQTTSPLRQTYHIDNAISLYAENNNSIVSVCESINHPYNSYLLFDNKYEQIAKEKKSRRQELPKSVSLNGAIYIKNVIEYLKNNVIITDKTDFYIMEKIFSIDIDDEKDFILAELIYKNIIIR
jgi:CMP-N,N'-diacetyllegionaminic acid synthase